MYLEEGMQYQGGEVVGSDKEGNLYKGVMVFMIISMLKNIPFVIKAVPERRIEGGWLQNHIEESMESLNRVGFVFVLLLAMTIPQMYQHFQS